MPPKGASEIQRVAGAIAAVFLPCDLVRLADGRYQAASTIRTLEHDENPMCADELFAQQPRGAWCGAVLVDDRTILTSNHCAHRPIADLRFAFDFEVRGDDTQGPVIMDPETVCAGTGEPIEIGPDLVLIDIACPEGFPVAPIDPALAAPTAGKVYAIGFPMRLPAKFSGWGEILPHHPVTETSKNNRPHEDATHLHAALDIFPGNSGSAVFSSAHELIGIVESDASAEKCLDNEKKCYRWDAIQERSFQRVRITSTHEVNRVLRAREVSK